MAKLIVLFALASALVASAQPAYNVYPWPTPSNTSLHVTMGYGTVQSTGTRFNWYSATLDDLSRFTFELPAEGCSILQRTTETANLHKCVVALNSGYFQFKPKPTFCLGNLIVNRTIEHWDDAAAPPIVGVTGKGTTVVGVLTRQEAIQLDVTYASSGFGVIVERGVASAAGVTQARGAIKAVRSGAEEVAPRTVFAVDAQNRMLMVAIDGVEQLKLGVTVDELAQIFSGGADGFPFNVQTAINLDGGGSTTFSSSPSLTAQHPAQIFNRPTDTDAGPISERAVTSIACVR
jgi:exopolysaccharide biosynthesis protein